MTLQNDFTFLFPSAVLGGHETMACYWIERILQSGGRVTCFAPLENQRLAERLELMSLELHSIPVRSTRLESIRALVDFRFVNRAAGFLSSIARAGMNVVVVQGDIETGSVFVVAGKRARVPVISYLPYCHSFHSMRKPLGWVRDLVNRWVYRSCPEYWVISPTFADQVARLHPKATISIRENFLPQPPRFSAPVERPANETHVVVVGRVYFPHKGQDLFLEALRLTVPEGMKVVGHVVGDGLDLARAQAMVSSLPPRVSVVFHGWLEPWWNTFSQNDILIISSRFEGVPLVMLEALSLGMRVLAVNRDGMADRLDPIDLYEGNSDREAIQNLKQRLQTLLSEKKI